MKAYPTGVLWIQFMDLVDIFKTGHRAQRTGSFEMYLKYVLEKQLYFPASMALSTNLLIEQELMTSVKNCRSAITHGRETDEVQRIIWLYSRPAFAHLKTELVHLYNQDDKMIIKELTDTRSKVDTTDVLNILQYIEEHGPFKTNSSHFVDISTGIS